MSTEFVIRKVRHPAILHFYFKGQRISATSSFIAFILEEQKLKMQTKDLGII